MRFVQDRPEENHHTDDAACIYFRRTSECAPTHLPCVGMGYTLAAHVHGVVNVELAPFELIGVGEFGAARSSSSGLSFKWTGSSHNYGVYRSKRQLLILESHGGGEQGYFDPSSHAIELFQQICATMPAKRIWDLCYLIANTQKQAYRLGQNEITSLFLHGRLRRRRRKGSYQMEVLPEKCQPATLLT